MSLFLSFQLSSKRTGGKGSQSLTSIFSRPRHSECRQTGGGMGEGGKGGGTDKWKGRTEGGSGKAGKLSGRLPSRRKDRCVVSSEAPKLA